jgi:choice-of-anchor A domain-containing protein
MTLRHLVIALLGAAYATQAPAAVLNSIDFGVASGYSAFIYGNASKVTDIEGRVAVGGNLQADAYSFGYRTPYGNTGPSVVVGGNLQLGHGGIFNGPTTNVNTNAGIGPNTGYAMKEGYAVYAGTNHSTVNYLDLRKGATGIDFNATKTKMLDLSTSLAALAANGTVSNANGGLLLRGDGKSDLQIFNLASGQVNNLQLTNVKAGAHVVINVLGSGTVEISGGQSGLEALRDRVLFNVLNATSVNVNTFSWGSLLANKADVKGTGHLEGNVIANSLSSALEIGYESFAAYEFPNPNGGGKAPEPSSVALLAAGALVMGVLARRRRRAR